MIPLTPMLLGYIRVSEGISPIDVVRLENQLADFAKREGYLLGVIYRDRLDGTGAFNTMLEAAVRNDAGVVVPTLEHLSVPPEVRIRDLSAAGIHLYAADASPARHGT